MSLHMFALWMVCLQVETMSFAIGHTASEIETLLSGAVEILRDVGGTSMMSVKGYHCLRRYICLAKAIGMYLRLHGCIACMKQDTDRLPPLARNPQNGQTGPSHNNTSNSADLGGSFTDAHLNSFLPSGVFLWDGFPDASMTHVGDFFYQHMDSDFLTGGGLGLDQVSATYGLPGIEGDHNT